MTVPTVASDKNPRPELGAVLLVHLSDIHFLSGSGTVTDIDEPLREAVVADLYNMRQKLGPADAVLVTGDIAYHGRREEYEAADEWLARVCLASGANEQAVLTVPGNHDVDRGMIAAVGRGVRRELRSTENLAAIDQMLGGYLVDESSDSALFGALQQYNSFAESRGCAINRRSPSWSSRLSLRDPDNTALEITGLTTVLVSDGDDRRANLILGSQQRRFVPDRRGLTIHLTMAHHPPDWLVDGDETIDVLGQVAALQLYGHKHRLRAEMRGTSLVLSAGASQPSRVEEGWDPRYNLLQLQIERNGHARSLLINAYMRRWDPRPDRRGFVTDPDPDGNEAHTFRISLPPVDRAAPAPPQRLAAAVAAAASTATTEEHARAADPAPRSAQQTQTEIAPDADADGSFPGAEARGDILDENGQVTWLRSLAEDFLSLGWAEQRRVLVDLDLLRDEDRNLNATLLFYAAFERAQADGRAEAFRDAVPHRHTPSR